MISAHQKRDKERMDSLLECSTRDAQWSRQLWNTFNASRHAVHATLLSQSGVPLPGRQQAASFIQLYSSKHALDDSPPCRQYRIALRDQLAHLPTYFYPLSKGDPFPLVHSAEIRAAIHSIRMGQAADIMGLHPILILHIAGMVMRQLCQLFNSCFSHGFVPRLWKSSIVIPILKPNKPRSVASSYEPESIISLLSRLMEALILRRKEHALRAHPLHLRQLGFRKGFSEDYMKCSLLRFLVEGSRYEHK